MKEANLQWLQDPSQITGGDMKSVRHETRRHFRNKERGYLKGNINGFQTNRKNNNIRDFCTSMNEFKKGYQLAANLVNDEG